MDAHPMTVSAPPRRHRWGRWLLLLAVGLFLLALFYNDLATDIPQILKPSVFNGDTMQHTWPLWHYHDSRLFEEDYIQQYYLALMPDGYEYGYKYLLSWADPVLASKVLSWVLFLILVLLISACAWQLAGPAAALGAGLLVISSDIFMLQMAGGMPRAFAFPLLAAAAFALIHNRLYLLAVVTCIGALFYPSVAVLCGCILALYSFSWGPAGNWSGISQQWSPPHRLTVLLLAGVFTVAAVLPSMWSLRDYGARISPADAQQVERFPELLERHPLILKRQFTYPSLYHGTLSYFQDTFSSEAPLGRTQEERAASQSKLVFPILGLVTLAGFLLAVIRQPASRRLLLLPLAALLTAVAGVALYPKLYYPHRFLMYAIPVFSAIAFPVALAATLDRLPIQRYASTVRSIILMIIVLAVIWQVGGQGSLLKGTADYDRGRIFSFISTLPPDVMIAGWPDDTMSSVPVISARPILTSGKTQIVFHENYVLEMRQRMMDLVDAYYATELAPLLKLREKYGVTHLLVDTGIYRSMESAEQPAPYGEQIAQAIQSLQGKGEPITLQFPQARVFEEGELFLLDLEQLPGS